MKNKPDFRRKPWPSISQSAKDFVRKLLVKDPRARLTAAQALCMCYHALFKWCVEVRYLILIEFNFFSSSMGSRRRKCLGDSSRHICP